MTPSSLLFLATAVRAAASSLSVPCFSSNLRNAIGSRAMAAVIPPSFCRVDGGSVATGHRCPHHFLGLHRRHPLTFVPRRLATHSALSAAGIRGPRRRSGVDGDSESYGSADVDDSDGDFSGLGGDSDSAVSGPDVDARSTSIEFAIDPRSEQAREITLSLGLTISQHEALTGLAEAVVHWNDQINLVSRRDCGVDVVFGRHVLPSAALCALKELSPGGNDDDGVDEGEREGGRRGKIVDVGTGGGFPGLPLAICRPELDFLLVDSVGKKLKAVEAMAEELGLDNVRVHHGRVEEMVDDDPRMHRGAYDLCLGRSVTALPKFCFWVSDLIRKGNGGGNDGASGKEGSLLYIIGGDVEESVISCVQNEVSLDDLLGCPRSSDKRALVLGARDVADIAKKSGETKKIRGTAKARPKSNPRKKRREAKGQWTSKKGDDTPKQRGYENFKRYNG